MKHKQLEESLRKILKLVKRDFIENWWLWLCPADVEFSSAVMAEILLIVTRLEQKLLDEEFRPELLVLVQAPQIILKNLNAPEPTEQQINQQTLLGVSSLINNILTEMMTKTTDHSQSEITQSLVHEILESLVISVVDRITARPFLMRIVVLMDRNLTSASLQQQADTSSTSASSVVSQLMQTGSSTANENDQLNELQQLDYWLCILVREVLGMEVHHALLWSAWMLLIRPLIWLLMGPRVHAIMVIACWRLLSEQNLARLLDMLRNVLWPNGVWVGSINETTNPGNSQPEHQMAQIVEVSRDDYIQSLRRLLQRFGLKESFVGADCVAYTIDKLDTILQQQNICKMIILQLLTVINQDLFKADQKGQTFDQEQPSPNST